MSIKNCVKLIGHIGSDLKVKNLDGGKKVSGKLTYQKYDNKEGIKRTSTIIIANDLLMLDKKTS